MKGNIAEITVTAKLPWLGRSRICAVLSQEIVECYQNPKYITYRGLEHSDRGFFIVLQNSIPLHGNKTEGPENGYRQAEDLPKGEEMKKLITIAIALMLACTTLTLTACGGREKFDMTKVNSLSDLNGAIVAAQTGTFHLDALKEQTTGVEVKEYDSFTLLLTALKSGAIDGYVAEEPTAYSVIEKDSSLAYVPFVNNVNGFTATDDNTGIAVAYATGSPLVAQTNEVIAGISTQTRAALMQQAVTMSANPDKALSEPIALSSSKTDTSNGTLKIAMECAYAPFNWTQMTDVNGAVAIQGSNLYANGYDVQVAKYIAAELGMKLEIYEAKWEALINGVQAGTYTGIIAGMSPTAEREEEVDFTACYYNSNLVIIYKKN